MNVWDFFPSLLRGVQYTLLVSVAALLIGAVIAIPVTAARRSRWRVLRFVGTAYVEILRGLPPLPWLFIAFFGLPQLGIRLQPLEAGIATFSLIAGAYLTEIYRSGFRAVPRGQGEAASALGLGRLHVYSNVLIPQAARTMTPLIIAYFIGLLKDSALVSVIGVHDITSIAFSENRNTGEGLTVFIAAAVLYLALSIPIGLFGRWVTRRLNGRRQRLSAATTKTEAVRIP